FCSTVLYVFLLVSFFFVFFFFQAEDGIRDFHVTGVQTCALPILVRVVADADWLVKQVVQQHEKLFILLLNAKGETIANIPIDSINGDVGEELQTLRSWLLEQLEGASKAGMESREENVLRDWSSD